LGEKMRIRDTIQKKNWYVRQDGYCDTHRRVKGDSWKQAEKKKRNSYPAPAFEGLGAGRERSGSKQDGDARWSLTREVESNRQQGGSHCAKSMMTSTQKQ